MTRAANIDIADRIFAEAQKIVITSGYQGINMRRLASLVGVSATTIYHYFKNKEAILGKLRIWAAEILNDRIRAISRTFLRVNISLSSDIATSHMPRRSRISTVSSSKRRSRSQTVRVADIRFSITLIWRLAVLWREKPRLGQPWNAAMTP